MMKITVDKYEYTKIIRACYAAVDDLCSGCRREMAGSRREKPGRRGPGFMPPRTAFCTCPAIRGIPRSSPACRAAAAPPHR